jgi:uncharacterized membrane protein
MNEKRQQLFSWQQQGLIKHSNIEQALEITQANQSGQQWLDFIGHLLLWLGMVAIAMGGIFFFAYNWDNLSSMQKFALIQVVILMGIFLYTQTQEQSLASTAILFFLALMIGALFALFGQTYQTGKDPWQLFFMWTVFITPLAFASRSSIVWILWIALANIGLYLYLELRHGLLGMAFQHERNFLFYALLNSLIALVLEVFYRKQTPLIRSRIAAQVALIFAMVAFSWVAIYSVFEFLGQNNKSFDLLIYLLWMAVIYYVYRIKYLDVLVLASWVVSAILFVLSVIARSIGDLFESGTLLLFAILILGFTAIGVKWLMSLHKQQNSTGELS